MPIINRVSAAVFDRPAKPRGRQPSPEQLALVAKLRTIRSEKDAYEVILEPTEKRATVRQRLARAATTAGVDLVIKPSSDGGFYIGLATRERRRGRGRRAAAAT